MQTNYEAEQISMYDLDTYCGRTSPEPFPAERPRAKISGSSSKKLSELSAIPFMSLDLTHGHGNLLGESYWEMISPWRGGASTLNTGVSPSDAKGSSLSQILQADPPTKYYLTPKACLGILRRASERGKELPKKLARALKIQAGLMRPDGQPTAPNLFIKMFADGRPITAEEYDELIALRMENTGKVTGAFDISFDKQEFSAVNIMDGWQSWSIRDISTATYHATRSQFASNDEKWRKLLEHLGDKELTSPGHLSAQNFSFSDEILMEDGKLNFYVQAGFDVDAAFGTFVCTDENDDWLNIYANYDIVRDRPCDTLELNLCKGDGTEENWSYHLNAAEQEVLARKMEAFCQQQNSMSLRDFARQLQEEPGPTPQMQM